MANALLSRLRPLLLLLAVALAAHPPATAQTRPDSTRVQVEEEEVVPAPAINAPPPAAPRLQVQEQTFWKLGLNNVLYLPANWSREVSNVPQAQHYGRYGLHLAAERKLRHPAWSVLAEISPYLLDYTLQGESDKGLAFCVKSQLAGRYYYNLGRRLRLGKSTGTFAANYFSVSFGGGFGQRAHESAFFFYPQSGPFARFDVALLYGLQRRLGRYGFADFSAGIPFAFNSGADTSAYYLGATGPTLAVNLRLGLCLGR